MKRECYRRKADDFEVDSEGRAKMREQCGTCKHSRYGKDGSVCVNAESEYFMDWIEYDHGCNEWEGKDER